MRDLQRFSIFLFRNQATVTKKRSALHSIDYSDRVDYDRVEGEVNSPLNLTL